jgi:hypothetical protein
MASRWVRVSQPSSAAHTSRKSTRNTTTPYDVEASTPFTEPECVDPRGCCFLHARAASCRLGIS